MALSDDLERIAQAAAAFAGPEERVTGILAAEPLGVGRVYLCAYASEAEHGWLALDEAGAPVASRRGVRGGAAPPAPRRGAAGGAGGGGLPGLPRGPPRSR